MSDTEKPAVHTAEPPHGDRNLSDLEKHHSDDEHEAIGGATFAVDEDELPPGYFTSRFFLGSMLGIGLGLMGAVSGFGYAAPILTLINQDIGPVSKLCNTLHTARVL